MSGRFGPGARVRVLDIATTGHVRTPHYVRSKPGTVERICGAFRKPEDLAYGRRDGAAVTLYRVRFAARELWRDYEGPAHDTIDVELYDHWLAPEPDA